MILCLVGPVAGLIGPWPCGSYPCWSLALWVLALASLVLCLVGPGISLVGSGLGCGTGLVVLRVACVWPLTLLAITLLRYIEFSHSASLENITESETRLNNLTCR